MDRIRNLSRDNKGSTIIMVIICIAFVSILCSILLFSTVSNLQIKAINENAKSNFYDTEVAFDEIKAGLEEVTADALADAYTEVMEQYIEKSETEKMNLFSETFINSLAKYLGGSITATKYDIGTIKGYLSNPLLLDFSTSDLALGKNELVKVPASTNEPSHIILRNIKVTYTNSDHYKTSISSDIIINTPSTGSSVSSTFAEYSLIADTLIAIDTATNVKVSGCIYAGNDGIKIDNFSCLTIGSADEIVTSGDISVERHSSLLVNDSPSVWAENIKTSGGAGIATVITINGKCYVADDLMLNAENSEVTIKGEYYGYSYNTYKALPPTDLLSAENSSGIIINGLKSSLDLSMADQLVIAGRAYIDPESSGSVDGKIFTGESIAIKGNQSAYLVPDEYMWCGTNPVALSEYEKYMASPGAHIQVDYDKVLETAAAIPIKDFVDDTDGFSNIFYNYSSTEQYVYYYLNFKSEEKANEYLQKYYEVYHTIAGTGIVDTQVKSNVNSITLKSTLSSIISAGNIFTFNITDGSKLLHDSTTLAGLKEISENLIKRYDSLQKDFNTIVHTENIDSTVFDVGGIKVKKIIVDADNVVYIVDNDYVTSVAFDIPDDASLPNHGRQGIIIATGEVNVPENCTYNGLILSGTTINLKAGAEVKASSTVVNKVLADPRVNQYFRGYASLGSTAGTVDSSRISVSDLIVYDRWKKNEE